MNITTINKTNLRVIISNLKISVANGQKYLILIGNG